jgi:hypothetical protein
MPSSQVRNADAQILGFVDHLNVEDRNFSAEFYDNVGGQSYLLGDPVLTVNIDTSRINSAPTIYSLASDVVTIAEAGLYLASFHVSSQLAGGSTSVVSQFWLEEDPDTGVFGEVTASRGFFVHAGILNSVSGASMTTLLQVGIDYRYRIRLEQIYGSSTLNTLFRGSKISFIRLFKNG